MVAWDFANGDCVTVEGSEAGAAGALGKVEPAIRALASGVGRDRGAGGIKRSCTKSAGGREA